MLYIYLLVKYFSLAITYVTWDNLWVCRFQRLFLLSPDSSTALHVRFLTFTLCVSGCMCLSVKYFKNIELTTSFLVGVFSVTQGGFHTTWKKISQG